MAKVKYRIREFKPTANQTGGHSVYAEAVVDNIITNKELARKVESRTGMRAYEVARLNTTIEAQAAEIREPKEEIKRLGLTKPSTQRHNHPMNIPKKRNRGGNG